MKRIKNINTVLQALKAEAKGDVNTTLSLLHPKYKMIWVYLDKHGKLFPATKPNIHKELEVVYKIKGRKYDIRHIAEGKNVVMLELIESYPDPKTKKVYRTPEVIVLEMKDGKIKKGRHYCDPRLSYLNLTANQIKKIYT